MKKSKIMLLGASALIVLALMTSIIFFRISADRFIKNSYDPEKSVEATGHVESKKFALEDFDSLHFEELWDVKIRRGDSYGITVRADKALLDEIEINQKGEKIYFSYDKFLHVSLDDDLDFNVEIIMPDLREIEIQGMGNIVLVNFNLDQLDLINYGASNINAKNMTINNLRLILKGAGNVELNQIDINNCFLDISGAANVELNMAGGELSGQISGVANVVYSGHVSIESVDISGLANLEAR